MQPALVARARLTCLRQGSTAACLPSKQPCSDPQLSQARLQAKQHASGQQSTALHLPWLFVHFNVSLDRNSVMTGPHLRTLEKLTPDEEPPSVACTWAQTS